MFDVTYNNLQGIDVLPSGLVGVGNSKYPGRAQGFEFEGLWKPISTVTLGGGVGYTSLKFSDQALPGYPAFRISPANDPTWTVDLNGQYESHPLDWARGGRFLIHADAVFTSALYPSGCVGFICTVVSVAALKATEVGPQWMANARMALTDIPVGQAFGQKYHPGSRARGSKSDRRQVDPQPPAKSIFTALRSGGEKQPARTFGVDLTAKF